MSVRVRYAPSPTGLQHVGGIRTALFNYLFARSAGGTFILRIEDTDRERFSEGALEDLYSSLEWLGIQWDEGPKRGGSLGPYVQSERVEQHRSYVDQLVESGAAYRCYCTPERLEALRQQQQLEKSPQLGYDRHCRELSSEERERMELQGQPYVIRFKVPLEGETQFKDLLLGKIKRKNIDISPDPVILKSDGYPTYHLANVVDDHDMEITHVMRAQEWLSSGALHHLIYRAFGWIPPEFCHLPMVMGKDGQKLSKRHGATALGEFRAEGYLPEAVINYLAMVGWSYDGSSEFFSLNELEDKFSLEKLTRSPGVFDYKKLQWYNGHYIRKSSGGSLENLLLPYLIQDGVVSSPPSGEELDIFHGAIPILQERLKLLSEVSGLIRFLFHEVSPDVELAIPKGLGEGERLIALREAATILGETTEAELPVAEERFRSRAEGLGWKLGQLLQPLRVAVTGSTVSPPLFESIQLLGLAASIQRIRNLIERIESDSKL